MAGGYQVLFQEHYLLVFRPYKGRAPPLPAC